MSAFEHRAIWNDTEQRVEMHLVSLHAQEVRLAGAAVKIRFEAGETIWTESPYKIITEDSIADLGSRTGFTVTTQWIDPEAGFALTLFEAI